MKQLVLQSVPARAGDLAWIRSELDNRKARNTAAAHIEHYYDLAGGDRSLALDALVSVGIDGQVHKGLRARLHAERQS